MIFILKLACGMIIGYVGAAFVHGIINGGIIIGKKPARKYQEMERRAARQAQRDIDFKNESRRDWY